MCNHFNCNSITYHDDDVAFRGHVLRDDLYARVVPAFHEFQNVLLGIISIRDNSRIASVKLSTFCRLF